ncbi:MAG: GNAT family N-acetyltransferase [Acidimicrobiia bacterium]|nr:GNAT family N-acetyltransferase [Acidimicrobiia bacterium]
MIERVDVTEVGFAALREIAGRSIAMSGIGSGLHPGDVSHARVGGLRGYASSDVFPVWVSDGVPVAFGVLWPMHPSLDLLIPDTVDDAWFDVIVDEGIAIARGDTATATVTVDPGQRRLDLALSRRGFGPRVDQYMVMERSLEDIPPRREIGYEIRGATHDDLVGIVEAHRSAFASSWTVDEYATYMTTAPYRPEREIVAVAPDGTIAGFAVIWVDEISRCGYFEPVGVHRDHVRRGVGSAVLIEGMRALRSEGMDRVSVLYALDSDNAPFYGSVGFAPVGAASVRSHTSEGGTR